MINVIRRLGFLLFLVVVLGACANGERAAVTVGDRSVSRAELAGYAQLVGELSQSFNIENDSTVETSELRLASAAAIEVLAQMEAIEEVQADAFAGIDRAEAALVVDNAIQQQRDAINTGQRRVPLSDFVEFFSESSDGYEFVTDFIYLSTYSEANPQVTELIRTDKIIELVESAEVESRIGVWVPAAGAVLSHEQAREDDLVRRLERERAEAEPVGSE